MVKRGCKPVFAFPALPNDNAGLKTPFQVLSF
jgi:hypothetical protein